ncbi:MAG: hypothetical protein WA771_01260 [Chthoniobacterales bacterium]
MKKTAAHFLVAATFGLLTVADSAAQLVVYPLERTFEPTDVNRFIDASGFGAFGSDAQVGLGVMEGKRYGYILIRKESKNSSQSRRNGQYGQFRFTQTGGFQGAITSMTFKAAVGGQYNDDNNGLALRWSYDDYGSDLANVTINNGPLNFRTFRLNFPSPLIFGGEVTFRLYAYSTRESGDGFGQSVRFQDLTVNGTFQQFAPDAGPPEVVVFGNSLRKKTRKVQYTLSGRASDENTVRVVQVARSRDGPYRDAEGTTRWNFTTRTKRGQNRFFVRAIDFAGSVSDPIKVTVRRRKAPAPTPSPTPVG